MQYHYKSTQATPNNVTLHFFNAFVQLLHEDNGLHALIINYLQWIYNVYLYAKVMFFCTFFSNSRLTIRFCSCLNDDTMKHNRIPGKLNEANKANVEWIETLPVMGNFYVVLVGESS